MEFTTIEFTMLSFIFIYLIDVIKNSLILNVLKLILKTHGLMNISYIICIYFEYYLY